MERPNDPETRTDERRRGFRRTSQGNVSFKLQSPLIRGTAENISRTGLLFVSDPDVRVEVEIDDSGLVKKCTGRLVYAQRVDGKSFGWAIEFDAPSKEKQL